MKRKTKIIIGTGSLISGVYLYFHLNNINSLIKEFKIKKDESKDVKKSYQIVLKKVRVLKKRLPIIKDELNDMQTKVDDFQFKINPKLDMINNALKDIKK